MSDVSAHDPLDVARQKALRLREQLQAELAELRQRGRPDGADLVEAVLRALRELDGALQSDRPSEAHDGNNP